MKKVENIKKVNVDLMSHLQTIYSCIPGIHEIRCFDRQQKVIFEGKEITKTLDGGMAIAFEDSAEKAYQKIEQHFSDIETHNIYVVLNKVADKFPLKTKNQLMGVDWKNFSKNCTNAKDIMSINSIVIDLDRAETIEEDGQKLCASQAELEEINKEKIAIIDFLGKFGLIPNTQIMSGNGYQVAYYFPSCLETTNATRKINELLYRLQEKFPAISVDPKVKDPSRVTRLAGSWNKKSSRKEVPEQERVYRQAILLETNQNLNAWECVDNAIKAMPKEEKPKIAKQSTTTPKPKASASGNSDNEEIDQALREISLLETLSRYFTIENVKEQDNKIILCCPFHHDKHPSAWIAKNENGVEMLHCSSCKFPAKTALHILQECGAMSFPEALQEIGIEKKSDATQQQPVTAEKKAKKSKQVRLAEYIRKFEELGYHFSMNDLTDDLYFNGKLAQDSEISRLRVAFREWGIIEKKAVNLAQVNDIMIMKAAENRFNPIKKYLDSLPLWDGTDRITKILESFPGAEWTARRWFEIWFAGAIRRVYENGKHFPSLVLISKKQGVGKSTFVKWLCPETLQKDLHLASQIRPEDKDTRIRLASTWIWEIEELGATTRKADVEALKAFLSTEQIRERKPYGRIDIVKPAITAFIGTINDNGGGFLVDPTGNRRFLIVNANGMNFDFQKIDIDQVWAQAIRLYQEKKYIMDDIDKAGQEEENKEHLVTSPIETYLEKHFEITLDNNDFSSLVEITECLSECGIQQNHRLSMEISAFFSQIDGVSKVRKFVDGRQVRGYAGVKKNYVSKEYSQYNEKY